MSKFLKSIYAGIAILALTSTVSLGAFPAITASAEDSDENMTALVDPVIDSIDAKDNDNGTVTFTVNASGGMVGTNLLFYKFYVLDENGEKVQINQDKGIGQNYSTDNTYICKPGTDGKFRICVEVQNSQNDVVSETKTYEINTDTPDTPDTSVLKINKIETNVTKDTVVNDDVKISADVTSDDDDLTYKFTVVDSKGNEVFSKETAKSTVTWTPKAADEYTIKVDVTDSQDNTESETQKVVIGTAQDGTDDELTINVSLSSQDVYVNKSVTIKAESNGGIGDKKYKFKDSSNSGVAILREYEEGNEFEWTPTSEGTHTLTVYVKDDSGVTKSSKITVNVKAEQTGSDKPSTNPDDSDKPNTNPDDSDNKPSTNPDDSHKPSTDPGKDNDGNNTGDLSKGILPIGTFAVMSLGYIVASLKRKNK